MCFVGFVLFEAGSHYTAQVGLELVTLLVSAFIISA